MPFKLTCLTAVLLLAAQTASAQFSSKVAVTSDYDLRGFTQTAKDPALQAGADYTFGGSGLALGAWASNVDFGDRIDGDIELDLLGSYTGTISERLGWATGFVYYLYPGSDDVGDYREIYGGLNIGPASLVQWYSDDLYDLGEDAWYTEANATIALPRKLSLLLHAGYAYGDTWDLLGGEVLDYAIGIGYTAGSLSLALKLVGTDSDIVVESDAGNNQDRAIFTISTQLPWSR